jgi:hypothetical protein
MNVLPEELQLAVWYLKQRNLIVSDDKSSLMITVDGMDYVEKHLPSPQSILALLKAVEDPSPVEASVAAPPAPPVATVPAPAPPVKAPPTAAPTAAESAVRESAAKIMKSLARF